MKHPSDELAESSLLSPRGEMLIATAEEEERFEQHMAGATETEDIDVDRLLQGYLRLLRRHGGRLDAGARATQVTRSNGVWRVTTAAGTFEAPVVVNASGAWVDSSAAQR